MGAKKCQNGNQKLKFFKQSDLAWNAPYILRIDYITIGHSLLGQSNKLIYQNFCAKFNWFFVKIKGLNFIFPN